MAGRRCRYQLFCGWKIRMHSSASAGCCIGWRGADKEAAGGGFFGFWPGKLHASEIEKTESLDMTERRMQHIPAGETGAMPVRSRRRMGRAAIQNATGRYPGKADGRMEARAGIQSAICVPFHEDLGLGHGAICAQYTALRCRGNGERFF